MWRVTSVVHQPQLLFPAGAICSESAAAITRVAESQLPRESSQRSAADGAVNAGPDLTDDLVPGIRT